MGETPVIPDHVLIRPIGQGAFGQVWLARNIMGTYRAVKVVWRSAFEDPRPFEREFAGVQRFEPVSRLHEGFVDLLQVGRSVSGDYFYCVMELGDDVEGGAEVDPARYRPRTLSNEARMRGRIPAAEAAMIGAEVADALHFLHGKGMVHRDIKPSNILFVHGRPKIADIGLVGAIGSAKTIIGTPGYMAPEGPGKGQADIYSLGKVVYELSTGKGPYEFPEMPTLMADFPDVGRLQELNSVVLRACHQDPGQRYATAQEFRAALLEVNAGGSPLERERTRRRLRVAIRVVGVLGVVLVLVMLAFVRARVQARADRVRLAQSYAEAAARLYDENDWYGALPYFVETMHLGEPGERLGELAARCVAFAWRHGPRLVGQWHFPASVNRVVFRADGGMVVAVDAQGGVWGWGWQGARPVRIGQHRGGDGAPVEVHALAVSGDGRWVASGGGDSLIRIWGLGVDRRDLDPIEVGSHVYSLAFDAASKRLVAGTRDGRIELHDLAQRTRRVLVSGGPLVRSVAFDPAGMRVVAGDEGGGLRLIPLDGGAPVSVGFGNGWVFDAAFNRDGTRWVAAFGNRAHLSGGEGGGDGDGPVWPFQHKAFVRSVSFNPDATPGRSWLLTSCLDNTVRLWDLKRGSELMPPVHLESPPLHASFSPDGLRFVVASVGGVVRVFDLAGLEPESTPGLYALSGDGRRELRHVPGGVAEVREVQGGAVVGRVGLAEAGANFLQLNGDGRRLFARQFDADSAVARFGVWDVRAGTRVGEEGFQRPATGFLSPDGGRVLVCQLDGLSLWEPGKPVRRLVDWRLSHVGDAEVRFDPSGDRAAAAWPSQLALIDLRGGGGVTLVPTSGRPFTVDFDPGGGRLAVGLQPEGYLAGTNWILDLGTLRPAVGPMVVEDGSYLVRFSRSGSRLFVADESKAGRLFDSRTGKAGAKTMLNPGIVQDAAFSVDEGYLATITGNRTDGVCALRVWDPGTGSAITPPLPMREAGSVYLVGDAREVVVSGWDGRVVRWNLEGLEGDPADVALLARLLSCREATPSGELVRLKGAELQRLWVELRERHPAWFAPVARR